MKNATAPEAPWLNLGGWCCHCASPIEARPSQAPEMQQLEQAGWGPMEYRHVETGSRFCAVQHLARPRDGTGDSERWKDRATVGENAGC